MAEFGKRTTAEKELAARAERVEKLHIHPLPAAERARFLELWQNAQTHFVDSPQTAVAEADRLVAEVMQARGYPMSDFEQMAADISVDHGQLVENYRHAHATAVSAESGQAGTEELRQALVHYRALFEELLQAPEPEPEPVAGSCVGLRSVRDWRDRSLAPLGGARNGQTPIHAGRPAPIVRVTAVLIRWPFTPPRGEPASAGVAQR